MKVIREKTILEKIDAEIDDTSKLPIVRIDLEEGEFNELLIILCETPCVELSYDMSLRSCVKGVSKSSCSYKNSSWLGSYVIYRGVCVQCCYGEGGRV